jgi:hypothetical protein
MRSRSVILVLALALFAGACSEFVEEFSEAFTEAYEEAYNNATTSFVHMDHRNVYTIEGDKNEGDAVLAWTCTPQGLAIGIETLHYLEVAPLTHEYMAAYSFDGAEAVAILISATKNADGEENFWIRPEEIRFLADLNG